MSYDCRANYREVLSQTGHASPPLNHSAGDPVSVWLPSDAICPRRVSSDERRHCEERGKLSALTIAAAVFEDEPYRDLREITTAATHR